MPPKPAGPATAPRSPGKPDTSRPDTSKPDISKPDISKPDISKPDISKPGTSKPGTSKPGQTKPGQTKPARPRTVPQGSPRSAIVPVPVPVPLAEPPPPAPTKGTHSGLPLPRYASLRSDEVFMRAGPGPRYPIEWVYKRRDYPVEIEREFDIWRLVRDIDGIRGWVNTQTLAPRRNGIVLPGPNTSTTPGTSPGTTPGTIPGATPGAVPGAMPGATPVERVLRREAREDSPAVARLKPGVLVRIRSCDAASDWCAAQVQDYRGFIRRTELWGVYPGEAVQ